MVNRITDLNKVNRINAKKAVPVKKTAQKQELQTDISDKADISSSNTVKTEKPKQEKPNELKLNRFTPLIDDDVMTADVMKEVEKAEKSILFETYLLNGKDGKALCDLLIKKKKQGLDVKVMLDPFMQKLEKKLHKDDPLYQMGNYLKENGVDFVEYPIKKLKGSITPSEHAKILVLDDRVAYLGGTNIDDTYNHDINVKIEGPAAKDMRALFDESWEVSTNPDPKALGYTTDPVVKNSAHIKVTSTSPSRSTVKKAVLDNIKNAKKSIHIEMFTLTDDEIEKELVKAKKRGVDVKVLLCDNKEIFHVPTFHVPNLSAAIKFKKAGIPTRWYVNDKFTQMHSKLCIFDNKKIMIGSANFIHNAFRGIHEYYGEIEDADLAQKMEKQFDNDWKNHGEKVKDPNLGHRMLGAAVEMIDDFIF